MTKIAKTTNPHIADAVAEIRNGLGRQDFSLVLYFHSADYDAVRLSKAVHEAYPSAEVVGCSTAGELVSGHMLDGGLVAMGIPRSLVPRAHVSMVTGLRKTPRAAAENLVREVFSAASVAVNTAELDRYAGILLMDGLSLAEEAVVSRIGELTDVSVVGGSAGDDLKFKTTTVSMNGIAESDAAVFILLDIPKGFTVVKTQSFELTKTVLTATEVDEASRTVVAFNGKPAAQAYQEAVGAATRDEAQAQFMSHPLGLVDAQGLPFVRSPQQFKGDSVQFYCAVKQGADLVVLNSRNIVRDTADDLRAVAAQNPLAAIINFNCILRTLELKARTQTEQYGRVFDSIPTVGFSTYGETYLGHINQTATMLALHK